MVYLTQVLPSILSISLYHECKKLKRSQLFVKRYDENTQKIDNKTDAMLVFFTHFK